MRSIDELTRLLNDIADLEPNKFKSRAYRVAVVTISDEDPESFFKRKHFTDLPGIGGSISAKIKEYIATGGIEKLNKLQLEHPEKLNSKYYKVRKGYVTKRISFDEASKLLKYLYGILQDANIDLSDVTACGSYRRNAELIGDLDVVVKGDDPKVMDHLSKLLKSEGYKINMDGSKHINFIIDKANMTPVDVIFTKPSEYPFCVLYLTGSQKFNIMMRAKAKQLGYKLNQYGLFDAKGKAITCLTEYDIFNKLRMNYVKPNKR